MLSQLTETNTKKDTKINKSDFHESITDIKLSFLLLKKNWKEFIKTEIFALVAFVLFIFIITISIIILDISGPRPKPRLFGPRFQIRNQFLLILFGLLVFYAFISSQFGLAHDIIVSGDMFTEFNNSFFYFRKHFIKYVLLSILILWLPLALIFEFSFRYFIEFSTLNLINIGKFQINLLFDLILVYLIQYIFFVVFNLSLASVTEQGSLLKGLKDNFVLLKAHPKRIFFSWTFFFLIFSLPSFVFIILSILIFRTLFTGLYILLGIFFALILISSVILGYPLMSLIATRIYTTTKNEEGV